MASRYRATLEAISQRTNTSLPSLLLSFGILHEVTAIAPLFGVFYTARYFGLGEQVVQTLSTSESTSWASEKARTYISEGERRVERVGRRYGIFGYEKRDPSAPQSSQELSQPSGLAGNLANMALAYAVTKAMIPLRIGVSLWLAPAFSRRLVDPIGRGLKGAVQSIRGTR